MKLNVEDPVCLAICYFMGASEQGKFTFAEFKKGCTQLNVDSIDKWSRVTADLRKSLDQDDSLFEKVYNFAFQFS